MISESPPHDPWTVWANSINSPQDSQWGECLTIPANFVPVVNWLQNGSWSPEGSDSGYSNEEEHIELADCLALQGTLSRSETPPPVTPTTIGSCHVKLYRDEATHEEGKEFESSFGARDSSLADTEDASLDFACAETSRADYEVYNELEDDEDDLPPFDEWYTSILQRTQAV